MPFPSLTASLTAALVLFHQTGVASPILHEKRTTLAPRKAVNFVDCTKNEKDKLEKGFADAATLGIYAYSNMKTDSKPWEHYFRTGDGKDTDYDKARSVWSMVESNNDPTNAPYTFSVRCGKKTDKSCKSGKSVGVTDSKPQDGNTLREMLICPLFFKDDSKETTHNLDFRKFEKPKRGQDNSWCAPGNNFIWYEVAGHTLLHEMTHLNAFGEAAGVPEHKDSKEGFMTHGTDDVGGLGNSYPVAARKLAEIWQKGQEEEGTLKPYQNAENLAGAALEWYMMDNCAKSGNPISEIPL
ncbi:hypothetical protein K505DRAFT_333832 [Melanomma pulvis-pyrius CBS 109.77]|uniref:Lysine-specific metallo-endopeptidase domain-containing protein n=1 Tax=Melanomma pulvis-pyrius CBS 109.77 TaxID=1314802 RepID=A0A6A6XN36_9PLEO|nr:hypothetical protein K505DRAFT_333832 [Melanomma pulvis-pyrius CBS 109.77]